MAVEKTKTHSSQVASCQSVRRPQRCSEGETKEDMGGGVIMKMSYFAPVTFKGAQERNCL